jgi:outer membrane protein
MKIFMLARNSLLSLVLGAALITSPAIAQDTKIGAVNVEKILRESNTAKAVSAKLEQEFSKRERELRGSADQFRAAIEKFEKEGPTMAEGQRTARQRQLSEQERDLQRRQRDFQEELNLRRNEALQQVIEKLNRIVRQIAETDKYDLIVSEAYYINPRVDITDKVMSTLDSAR